MYNSDDEEALAHLTMMTQMMIYYNNKQPNNFFDRLKCLFNDVFTL